MAKIKYTATFAGRTFTRTSARTYTHAAIHRSDSGRHVQATFHESKANAEKASVFLDQTRPCQRRKGSRVWTDYPRKAPVAVVPLDVGGPKSTGTRSDRRQNYCRSDTAP